LSLVTGSRRHPQPLFISLSIEQIGSQAENTAVAQLTVMTCPAAPRFSVSQPTESADELLWLHRAALQEAMRELRSATACDVLIALRDIRPVTEVVKRAEMC